MGRRGGCSRCLRLRSHLRLFLWRSAAGSAAHCCRLRRCQGRRCFRRRLDLLGLCLRQCGRWRCSHFGGYGKVEAHVGHWRWRLALRLRGTCCCWRIERLRRWSCRYSHGCSRTDSRRVKINGHWCWGCHRLGICCRDGSRDGRRHPLLSQLLEVTEVHRHSRSLPSVSIGFHIRLMTDAPLHCSRS